MATYLGTHGGRIQNYTTDPDNPNTGEVWYNATANTIKIEALTAVGSWSTGGTTNQVRSQAAGSGADKDAALVFAGYTGTAATAKTENYDGSSWTEVNDLNTARRYVSGCGTNTAALCTGGYSTAPSVANEQWNGTNWTEVGDLTRPANRTDSSEFGITTAALYFGGEPAGAVTEQWNGTNWTEVNDLNTGRFALTGFGTTTAGVAAGGRAPSVTGATEIWNGTNWTEVNDLNTARGDASASQAASSTTGIVFIGSTGNATNTVANTELWNGTNWTETTDLSTARYRGMGGGTGTSAICATGYNGTARTSLTEEFTGAGTPVVKTISTD
jgi:hypothetical protein